MEKITFELQLVPKTDPSKQEGDVMKAGIPAGDTSAFFEKDKSDLLFQLAKVFNDFNQRKTSQVNFVSVLATPTNSNKPLNS